MALSNMNALSVAMNAEQDVSVRALKLQLEEKQLALERARMSTEDARAAMASPYSTHVYTADSPPRRRILSWREVGVERIEMCDYLMYNVMEPAKERLEEARQNIRTASSDPNLTDKAALNAAYVAMYEVTGCLEDNSDSSESASESET